MSLIEKRFNFNVAKLASLGTFARKDKDGPLPLFNFQPLFEMLTNKIDFVQLPMISKKTFFHFFFNVEKNLTMSWYDIKKGNKRLF